MKDILYMNTEQGYDRLPKHLIYNYFQATIDFIICILHTHMRPKIIQLSGLMWETCGFYVDCPYLKANLQLNPMWNILLIIFEKM